MAYPNLRALPEAVRASLTKAQQVAYRRAYNKAEAAGVLTKADRHAAALKAAKMRKDGPTVSAVHVDSVSWRTKPKLKTKPPVQKHAIIKADEERRYTLGVVYEPDEVDTQDDFTTAAEIEQACWEFNRQHIGTGREFAKGALGIQHRDWNDEHGEIIESYIAPCPMQIGDQMVKAGTWLMGCIWSPENWAKIQNGELTGLSMGGQARREEA